MVNWVKHSFNKCDNKTYPFENFIKLKTISSNVVGEKLGIKALVNDAQMTKIWLMCRFCKNLTNEKALFELMRSQQVKDDS